MKQIQVNISINTTSALPGTDDQSPGLEHRVYVFLVFAIILIIIAITNNTLVIFAYKVNRRMHNRTIAILVSLAVSDLLVGAVSMPLWMCMMSAPQIMSMSLFIFYMSFDIFSAFASILHLAGVSVERYLAIARPLRHRTYGSRFYSGMLASIWILAASIATLFPVQLHFQWNNVYALFVFINGFIIPGIIIFAVYISIFKIANSHIFPGTNLHVSRRFQAEKKLTRTGVMITFLFFITWCPFFIVSLIGTFGISLLTTPSPTFMWHITMLVKFMHYSNSALNTFVYAFSSREMRKTFIWLLCCQSNVVLLLMQDKPRTNPQRRQLEGHSIDSV